MPGPCSVDGCNDYGHVRSPFDKRKYCLRHYADSVMPFIDERRQNEGWVDARIYADGRIVEIYAADRQELIECALDEPYVERAVEHHRGILALLDA